MTNQLHIIYIPGLGIGDYTGQRRVLQRWEGKDVTVELFPVKWSDGQPWAAKFKQLLLLIDKAASDGSKVGLVGASAGASAVINAFAVRRKVITGCVLVAGKVNYPAAIGPRVRRENSAYIISAYDCAKALESLSSVEKQHILSCYGFRDMRVPMRDSVIPGAHNQRVLAFGHFWTIASQLVFGGPKFIRFLKSQTAL